MTGTVEPPETPRNPRTRVPDPQALFGALEGLPPRAVKGKGKVCHGKAAAVRSTAAGAGRGRRWGGVPRSRKAKAQQDSTIRPSIHQLLPPSLPSSRWKQDEAGLHGESNAARRRGSRAWLGPSGGGPAAAPPLHSFLQHRWREARGKFSLPIFSQLSRRRFPECENRGRGARAGGRYLGKSQVPGLERLPSHP